MKKNWKKNKKEKTTILYDVSPSSEKDPARVCNKENESISQYATANQISNFLPPIKRRNKLFRQSYFSVKLHAYRS